MCVIRRTVIVKLDVPDERRGDLKRTTERFQRAAQMVADRAFERDDDGYVITTKQELHGLTYDAVREATDELNADLVCAARNYAADALKGVVDAWQDGTQASKPQFTANTVVYNKNALTYHEESVSLATVNGRVECEYILPPEGDNPQTEYLRSEEWDLRESTLHYRDGDYYLHVGVARDDEPQPEAEGGTVLGVDLNVTGYVAVTSTGAFFESADYLTHVRDEYEQVRGGLQETGTQSAHRTLGRIGSRFAHWSDQVLHSIANNIVAEAVAHDCDTIAFEDLTDIRDHISNASKFQQWAFRRLAEYVEYKAEAEGIGFGQVNPQYTSRRCSMCGFTHANNRDDKHFECLKCGYELDADYNAAKNIGMKYVRSGQKSSDGRASSHLALKSGTLNGNGEFSPASTEA